MNANERLFQTNEVAKRFCFFPLFSLFAFSFLIYCHFNLAFIFSQLSIQPCNLRPVHLRSLRGNHPFSRLPCQQYSQAVNQAEFQRDNLQCSHHLGLQINPLCSHQESLPCSLRCNHHQDHQPSHHHDRPVNLLMDLLRNQVLCLPCSQLNNPLCSLRENHHLSHPPSQHVSRALNLRRYQVDNHLLSPVDSPPHSHQCVLRFNQHVNHQDSRLRLPLLNLQINQVFNLPTAPRGNQAVILLCNPQCSPLQSLQSSHPLGHHLNHPTYQLVSHHYNLPFNLRCVLAVSLLLSPHASLPCALALNHPTSHHCNQVLCPVANPVVGQAGRLHLHQSCNLHHSHRDNRRLCPPCSRQYLQVINRLPNQPFNLQLSLASNLLPFLLSSQPRFRACNRQHNHHCNHLAVHRHNQVFSPLVLLRWNHPLNQVGSHRLNRLFSHHLYHLCSQAPDQVCNLQINRPAVLLFNLHAFQVGNLVKVLQINPVVNPVVNLLVFRRCNQALDPAISQVHSRVCSLRGNRL